MFNHHLYVIRQVLVMFNVLTEIQLEVLGSNLTILHVSLLRDMYFWQRELLKELPLLMTAEKTELIIHASSGRKNPD